MLVETPGEHWLNITFVLYTYVVTTLQPDRRQQFQKVFHVFCTSVRNRQVRVVEVGYCRSKFIVKLLD